MPLVTSLSVRPRSSSLDRQKPSCFGGRSSADTSSFRHPAKIEAFLHGTKYEHIAAFIESEGCHARSRSRRARRPRRRHHRHVCPRMGDPPQAMSSKRLDTISDYARHGYMLRVECRSCQRVAIIHPMEISLLCQRRNWSRQIAVVERRLRCSKCGSRDVRAGPEFRS